MQKPKPLQITYFRQSITNHSHCLNVSLGAPEIFKVGAKVFIISSNFRPAVEKKKIMEQTAAIQRPRRGRGW